MTPTPLKLLAQDAEDISVMSAVLQDAIAPVCDMVYRASEKNFVMVVQRFCWDCSGTAEGDVLDCKTPEAGFGTQEIPADQDEPPLAVYERIACALDIEGVVSVQFQGINQNDPAALLDLLTMAVEDDHLQLIFAGGGKLRLKLAHWRLKMQDFGESWPTTHIPRHAT